MVERSKGTRREMWNIMVKKKQSQASKKNALQLAEHSDWIGTIFSRDIILMD